MTRWGRLGLRARVTVAFALGSLALTLTLSALAYTLATNQLIRQREQSALRLTVVNARLIQGGLGAADVDVPELLASLDTTAGSQPVLRHRDRWFGSSLAPGDQVVPAELSQDVLGGTAAASGSGSTAACTWSSAFLFPGSTPPTSSCSR
jgi:two-component system, OmpR family, sensor histidine kinase MtrB